MSTGLLRPTYIAQAGHTVLARSALVLLALVVLQACGARTDDLDDFFKTVKNKPGGTIEPLPEFAAYEPFAYSAMGLRSPFDPPIRVKPRAIGPGGKEVKPDLNRPKQFLEQFNIIDLKMVGTLNRPGEFYGLVREPSGGVHRVRVGDFMGQNYGRITGIGQTSIELTEIVSDGVGGWQERNRTLNLGGGGTENEGENGAAGADGAASDDAPDNEDSGDAQP